MCSKRSKMDFLTALMALWFPPFFLFAFFFVSGGTITNDLSTARNRSIIWRHCLCIGNGSGNIARNTNTGIGLMYIYVIFLTMPSLFERKTIMREKVHISWHYFVLKMLYCGVFSDWKFITEISLVCAQKLNGVKFFLKYVVGFLFASSCVFIT